MKASRLQSVLSIIKKEVGSQGAALNWFLKKQICEIHNNYKIDSECSIYLFPNAEDSNNWTVQNKTAD